MADTETQTWKPFDATGVALYTFAQTGDQFAALTVGDPVIIHEEAKNWYRGVVVSTGQKGIFPSRFITIKNLEDFDVVTNELSQVIREWSSLLKSYYRDRRNAEYKVMKERLNLLVECHSKIFSGALKGEALEALKTKVTEKIQEGRVTMGLDMIVRTPNGEQADETNTNAIPLYQMHQELAASSATKDQVKISAKKQKHVGPVDEKDAASSNNLTALRDKDKDNVISNLFLDFKIFMCMVGEQTELYFSLYSKGESKFVSDEFQVVLTAHGMPSDIDKIGKLHTLFVDISKKDLSTGLYLVCRLIRKGRMLLGEAGKKQTPTPSSSSPGGATTQHCRRPFGCAVLPLEGSVATGKAFEHTVPVYSTNQEQFFCTLHELIIKGQTNLYHEVPKAKGICIGLQMYHGEYKQVIQDNAALQGVPPTPKILLPEIIMPGLSRNDIYVTLEGGDFLQERKTTAKNIEVLIQVRLENGELVKDCIYTGSEKYKLEHRSVVYYHTNDPHFNETVRIVLPPILHSRAYLVVSGRHCSSKEGTAKEKPPFTVGYMKFTNPDGTVLADKTHSIICYKPGKSLDEPIPNFKDNAVQKLLRKGEVIKVRTTLVSTLCTQNLSLYSLLKWTTYHGDLADLLNRFTFVDQLEIIKFLKEIFDSMFAILDGNKVEPSLVYNAIVFIIGIIMDERTSRFQNFRPVLDVYIQQHLKSTKAHHQLITCVLQIFGKIDAPQSFKLVMPTLKSLEYIFKFIIISWMNHCASSKPSDEEQSTFKADVAKVFASFNTLMRKNEREFIGAQTVALKNFISMFSDLQKLYTITERSKITSDFIDNVNYDESKKLLNMEKLSLMLNVIESDLFEQKEARSIMMPTLVKHLKQHLSSSSSAPEELSKCAQILQVIINCVQDHDRNSDQQISELYQMLPDIMTNIQAQADERTRVRLDLIHCMFSIFYLMEPRHFDKYLKDRDAMPRKEYLLSTFTLLEHLLATNSTYPDNWLTLNLFQNSIVRKLILIMTGHVLSRLEVLRGDKKAATGPQRPPRYSMAVLKQKQNTQALGNEVSEWNASTIGQEYELWASFFKLCFQYIKRKSLQLENFSEGKQKTIKARHGDMRLDVIDALGKLWDALGKNRIHLLEDAVGPFLQMYLINQPYVSQSGLALYTSLLHSEYTDTQSLVRMETATINSLDLLLNEQGGGEVAIVESFRVLFTKSIPEKFPGDDALAVKARKFLKDTTLFLELLSNLRTLPTTPEYEDDRTIATMKLMAYLKQYDRRDTYVKYVHKLTNQHVASSNFIEAGLTLLLHADLLDWTEDIVDELTEGGFPAETQKERKERLYKLSIDLLDKGKAWEKAIQLCIQLQTLYEEKVWDYPKLADILQMESGFYRKIASQERFFAEYFRVGYYGKGFDSSVQGKEFIYRGFELERMADFVQRIQGKFPNAKLLTYTDLPPPEILNSPGQYLQIYAVKPAPRVANPSDKVPDRPLPTAVSKYRSSNNVDMFLYSKPFKKTKAKSGNEFKDLWIMNYYYVTEDSFPTIHRRSEIIRKTEEELAPIYNALNSMKSKNVELVEMVAKHEQRSEPNISPFTMVLKGVIDAAVNGGVNLYKEAFFIPAYVEQNPTHVDSVEQLKKCLTDQVTILEKGLKIHRMICPADMAGLQEQLDVLFEKMKSEVLAPVEAPPPATAS